MFELQNGCNTVVVASAGWQAPNDNGCAGYEIPRMATLYDVVDRTEFESVTPRVQGGYTTRLYYRPHGQSRYTDFNCCYVCGVGFSPKYVTR